MTAEAKDKIRVAILGGGIAALTTAFELTEQDPRGATYDITVYTLGWRLGGKAAVGRDMTNGGRAVEHGLHIWAGYYDNSFDIVKRLYARLNKAPDAWKACFEPLNHFTAMEFIKGEWKPWLLQFPQNDLEPGLGPLPALTPLPLLIQFFRDGRRVQPVGSLRTCDPGHAYRSAAKGISALPAIRRSATARWR